MVIMGVAHYVLINRINSPVHESVYVTSPVVSAVKSCFGFLIIFFIVLCV